MASTSRYREGRASLLPATLWTAIAEAGERAILPDGSMDLIWDDEQILVAGADRQPNPHRASRSSRLVAIRFDPGVAPAVLGVPADELVDQRVDLATVWPSPLARRWSDALATAADPVAELERLAANRLTSSPLDPSWAIGVTSALQAGRTIDAVAGEFSTGARQLHRRSQAAFGYGPKLLQRILRVRRAAERLRAGHSLTTVAADSGFADYSHMFRDFRAITGHPPVAVKPR
jgi:AraC-like DNA-binding protein